MKRSIDDELKKWKDKAGRKVLLLRGARQVGKTYSIRNVVNLRLNALHLNYFFICFKIIND